MAEDPTPQQMWEILRELKDLRAQGSKTDTRIDNLVRALDGEGHQPGIRQQLRELKHAVEGNPPAMRGIVAELIAINQHHEKLREDFEGFVKNHREKGAAREAVWGGAKMMWGILGTILLGLLSVIGLLVQIYTATAGKVG